MTKAKTEFKDIFKGDFLYVWKDEDTIFFSTPFATLNFSEEEWEVFKKDIAKLSDL